MKLTTKPGNPANALASEYASLMAIECPVTLAERARALVARGGISSRNAAQFERTLRKETSLDRLRSYLTNFMLKADGLGVI